MSDERTAIDVLRSSRMVAYTIGAACLIAGLFLLFWPERSWTIAARVVGILLVIVGGGQIFDAISTHRSQRYWGLLLARGALNLAVGLALVIWPGVTVTVVVWLIGLNLVVTGAIGLGVSFQIPKELGRSGYQVQSVIGILLGLLIMGWPDDTVNVISLILAAVLLLTALVFLWSGYQIQKATHGISTTTS